MAYLCSRPPPIHPYRGKIVFLFIFPISSVFRAPTRYSESIVGALLIILFRVLRFQATFSKPSSALTHHFSITLFPLIF